MQEKMRILMTEIAIKVGQQAKDNALILLALVLLGIALLIASLWDWAYWSEQTFRNGNIYEIKVDRGRILQQFIVVVLGIPALGFAIWRSITAHRQAAAALLQARTAARGQILDRYASAAALLDSERITVRAAGVFALTDLALENPAQYYKACLSLMARHARESAVQTTGGKTTDDEFETVLKQLTVLRTTVPNSKELEDRRIDLSDIHLEKTSIYGLLLKGAIIHDSNFKTASIIHCNLSQCLFFSSSIEDTSFDGCSLEDADFSSATLKDTSFQNSNIGGCDFSSTTGLTTNSIASAWAWKGNPPNLPNGVAFTNYFDPGPDDQNKKQYDSQRTVVFDPPVP